MGCNCRCKCGDEETVEETATTTNTTQGPIVSNVSSGVYGKKIEKKKNLGNLWGLFGAESDTFNSLWVGDTHQTGGSKKNDDSEESEESSGWWSRLLSRLNPEPEGDNSDNPKLAGDGGVTAFEAAGRNNNLTAQKINDLADWFNYPQREQFLFNSEINESMNGSSNTVDHINPTEVQGSEDIMGAEEVIWPQFTQNISGQGRTFANTIHPGMVIPNPDNYPTPQGNSPWAPYVNIRTYGDILNAVYPPYPSAMEWATNPQNYKEYPSTDWYTP